MQKRLEGKTAIVDGGSRGIGAAIARRLASEGADVAITYTKGADAATGVVSEIERAGEKPSRSRPMQQTVKRLPLPSRKPLPSLARSMCSSIMPR